MKRFALIAALGASCLAIAACSRDDSAANNSYDNVSATEAAGAEGAEANGAGAGAAASTAFPKGARIVEEKGVTYRIDPDGTRVALTDTDSKIVIEDGKRYRVDPDGTRVRIDDRGLSINLPDVDVGINDKGHPDIDVKTKGDNNAGPD